MRCAGRNSESALSSPDVGSTDSVISALKFGAAGYVGKGQAVRASFWVLAPLLLSMNSTLADSTPPAFEQATAPREWNFPRDHGRHDGFKTEWWYFTGNVRDAGGRLFGYQLTFFRTAFLPQAATRPSPWAMNDLYFAHAAVSDIDGKKFLFKDRLARGRPGLADASDHQLDVNLLDWSAVSDGHETRLKAADKDFAIELTCDSGRGPVLQGPGGVNRKGREKEQASYYYSMTRLPTQGTLSVVGRVFHVEGLSWMDHEFSSNAMSKDQVGWDWMGLHLSNGDDLMIYRLRNHAGSSDFLSGTRIAPDGSPHYLSAADITLEGSEPWTSAASGGSYPQRWKLQVAGLPPMVVASRLAGQELITTDTTKVNYFEGSASVTDEAGRPAGEGYLEMTGYAKSIGGSF